MQPFPSNSNNFFTVDIRLCGDIPRNEMKERLGAPGLARRSLASRPSSLNASCLAETNGSPTLHKTTICDAISDLMVQKSEMNRINDGQVLQPVLPSSFFVPKWAVPARGESRLEVRRLRLANLPFSQPFQPVCESLGLQRSVDLTKKKSFLVGRSPGCDVQLMHATSSRRHAMLFHHANGSCYVVDCGSAHGTFVNGKRIPSPTSRGVIIPRRLRRGSLVRFGGPGAPCFVLKCFSTLLSNLICDDEDSAVQVLKRNTRLNAIGKTDHASYSEKVFEPLTVERKRSFDSLSSTGSVELEVPDCKRVRCSSPPICPEAPLRLVSPDLPMSPVKCRRVTFSMEPQYFYPNTVTPDISSDEDDS